MNDLTKRLVIKTAKANKAAARENGDRFYTLLLYAHQDWLISDFGWKLKQRSIDLFRLWHPELYDGEFIQDYHQLGFDIDVCLSEIAAQVMWRRVGRCPELQLNKDWGDLPVLTVQPQLELF